MKQRSTKCLPLPEEDRQLLFQVVRDEGLANVLEELKMTKATLANVLGGEPIQPATAVVVDRYLDECTDEGDEEEDEESGEDQDDDSEVEEEEECEAEDDA